MLDIIYSYTAHEEPEVFIDTLRNLFYYNSNLDIAVVVHCNIYMYDALKKIDIENKYKNVYLTDSPYNKTFGTFKTITQPHIDNFLYCKKLGIISKYIIQLASNCYFHKHITSDLVDMYMSSRASIKQEFNYSTWAWPNILKNKVINTILSSNGINYLCCNHHEGTIIEYTIMNSITDIIVSNELSKKIEYETVFEEYLFASIYYHLTGFHIASICHIFWDKPGYQPSIKDILACDAPVVKRVDRKKTNIIRMWQNKLTSNYEEKFL